LVDDDAEDPGAEAGLPAKAVQHAEDAQEDLLRDVEGLLTVAKEVERQLVNHALVLGHQLGVRELVSRRAALDEGRLTTRDAVPNPRACRFEHQVLGHPAPPL
jgi:hypothetical protein